MEIPTQKEQTEMEQYLHRYCDAPREYGSKEKRSADEIKTKTKRIVVYDEKRWKAAKTKLPRNSSRTAGKSKTTETYRPRTTTSEHNRGKCQSTMPPKWWQTKENRRQRTEYKKSCRGTKGRYHAQDTSVRKTKKGTLRQPATWKRPARWTSRTYNGQSPRGRSHTGANAGRNPRAGYFGTTTRRMGEEITKKQHTMSTAAEKTPKSKRNAGDEHEDKSNQKSRTLLPKKQATSNQSDRRIEADQQRQQEVQEQDDYQPHLPDSLGRQLGKWWAKWIIETR